MSDTSEVSTTQANQEYRHESVHLKDIKEAKSDSLDVPYGQGIGNIAGILAELKRQKFRGHVNVEYEHTTDQLLDDVKHCLNLIRTHKP